MSIVEREEEYVVLVDEDNKVLGTSPKSSVHTLNTPLHRGFSCFLFNKKGEILLQQRSSKKVTWPLVWSNTCCGHPKLEEKTIQAAKRRLEFELGIKNPINLIEVIPFYRYKYERFGVVENEICPVAVGLVDEDFDINKDEVEAVKFQRWEEFVEELKNNPEGWSEWCRDEVRLLLESKKFENWLKNII